MRTQEALTRARQCVAVGEAVPAMVVRAVLEALEEAVRDLNLTRSDLAFARGQVQGLTEQGQRNLDALKASEHQADNYLAQLEVTDRVLGTGDEEPTLDAAERVVKQRDALLSACEAALDYFGRYTLDKRGLDVIGGLVTARAAVRNQEDSK